MNATIEIAGERILKMGVAVLIFAVITSVCIAGEARPDRWRWSNPSPHGNNVLDLNVQSDVAVQVGDAGSIHIQRSDGRWAPVNTGYKNYLRSTVLLGDRIIVTGESGLILWSDDGIDFQPSELSPVNSLDWFEGVCASSQRAVAVGDYGAIYSSTNGMLWTSAPSGTTEWLRGVAFGGSAFVAVGENGTILKASMSAGSWSPSASGTGEHLNRVRYLGGNTYGAFYAVGNYGTLLKSSDGSAWSALTTETTNAIFDVAINNSAPLVVGDQELRLSLDDGSTWSDQIFGLASNAAPEWTYLSAYGKGNAWQVAGRTGLLLEGTLPAGNEFSWTESPSDSSRAWLWDMTELKGIRVAVGDLANIQTSLDGILWAREAVPVSSTNTVLLGVGGTTNLIVAVGNEGNVLVSESGLMEISVTNEVGTTHLMVDTFGVVWTNVPAFTTASLQGIDAREGLFITCGGHGELYTSPDGRNNWVSRVTGTSSFLSSVAIGSGSQGALGIEGFVVHGHDKNRQRLIKSPYGLGQFKSVGPLEANIDHRNVGAVFVKKRQGLGSAFGFIDNHKVRFSLDQ